MTDDSHPAGRYGIVVAAGLLALYLVRPGVIENGVRSPRVWLAVAVIVVVARLVGAAVRRTTGRPAVASAASTLVVAAAATALLLPSFQQRTLDEPFPAAAGAAQPAVQVPEASPLVASPRVSPPAAPAPVTASAAREQPARAAVAPARTAAPGAVQRPQTAATPAARPARPPTSRPAAQATTAPAPAPAAADGPRRLSSGALDGIGHSASGRTALYDVDGATVLRFEDVDIEGTPASYVYLVRQGARTPDGGVLLGELKAERGSFSYSVPAGVDPAAQWSVLIWCRPYDTPVAASDHR